MIATRGYNKITPVKCNTNTFTATATGTTTNNNVSTINNNCLKTLKINLE